MLLWLSATACIIVACCALNMAPDVASQTGTQTGMEHPHFHVISSSGAGFKSDDDTIAVAVGNSTHLFVNDQFTVRLTMMFSPVNAIRN